MSRFRACGFERGRFSSILLAALLVVVAMASVHAPFVVSADTKAVLVVDDDGDAAFSSIQAAVDDAEAGDTVRVEPGTYHEQVSLAKDVTVITPAGATLDGREFDGQSSAFRIEEGAAPVIEGFTIRNYGSAVNADRPPRQSASEFHGADGWVVRNVTIRNCSETAIRAGNSMVDWTVEGVSVDGGGCYEGIVAFGSRGDWTIRNTVIEDVAFDGVRASTAGGDWTIRNTSIADANTGIDAGFSNGNGTIVDVTVRGVESGISFDEADASVTIAGTRIEDVGQQTDDSSQQGVAVSAVNASGDWRVHDSLVGTDSRVGVDATGSSRTGDATGNWWGPTGLRDDSCLGNVRCTDALSHRPDAGASLDAVGAPTTSTNRTTRKPSRTGSRTENGTTSATRSQSDQWTASATTAAPTSGTTSITSSADDRSTALRQFPGMLVVIAVVAVSALAVRARD